VIERSEQIKFRLTFEQVLQNTDGCLWQLLGKKGVVAMFYFKETSDIVGLMLHQADKTPVYTFRPVTAVAFVLELTLLMAIELVFIHWQSKSIYKSFQIRFNCK